MDKAEFDRFADAYYDQHRENVAVTGESPEYFAEYKIRQLRQIVEREQVGVSRICDFGKRDRQFDSVLPKVFSGCGADIVRRLGAQPHAGQTALPRRRQLPF